MRREKLHGFVTWQIFFAKKCTAEKTHTALHLIPCIYERNEMAQYKSGVESSEMFVLLFAVCSFPFRIQAIRIK